MVKRQQFTTEFKLEAVRQMRAGSKPIAQLSRELGIPRNRLYKWNQAVQTHGEQEAFPGSGRRSLEQAELMRFVRSEEHPSELQQLMRISLPVFCLKKKINTGFYEQLTYHP